MVGFLNPRTHSITASIAFIAAAYLIAAGVISTIKIRNPLVAGGKAE